MTTFFAPPPEIPAASYRVGIVVALLNEQPRSRSLLVKATGWQPSTVKRALKRAQGLGLVHCVRGRWYPGPPAQLPAEWREVLWRMGPDLTAHEWAKRIGCPVQLVLHTLDKLPPYAADWTSRQAKEAA